MRAWECECVEENDIIRNDQLDEIFDEELILEDAGSMYYITFQFSSHKCLYTLKSDVISLISNDIKRLRIS